jgi:hypothetical protein
LLTNAERRALVNSCPCGVLAAAADPQRDEPTTTDADAAAAAVESDGCRLQVVDAEACSGCQQCTLLALRQRPLPEADDPTTTAPCSIDPSLPPVLTVRLQREHFLFTVETTGVLSAARVFQRALQVLRDQLGDLRTEWVAAAVEQQQLAAHPRRR